MDKSKMSAFASDGEMRSRLWTPNSFFLGKTVPRFLNRGFEIGFDDDRAVFIVAGSRAGKGTSILINNLIGWPGGAFCIDPKGELASLTGIRRGRASRSEGTGTSVQKFLGQDVAALDPFGEVKGPARLYRENYNPLDDIHPGSEGFVSDVQAISSAIVLSEKGANAHFSDMARILLAGTLEAGLLSGRAGDLSSVAGLLRGSWEDLARLLEGYNSPLAMAALGAVRTVYGSREGNAVYTTLSRQLSWLDEPRMKNHLRASGFSLVRSIQSDSTVYAVLPVNEMENHKRWLRLMLSMAIRAKIRQGVFRRGAQQNLFVVDEMRSLGTMQELEEGVSYLAGYGIKLACVVQNLGQLKELYRSNWQTFLGNAGAVIAFGLMDQESAEYVSRRLGQHYVERASRSRSTNVNTPVWTGGTGLFGSRAAVQHEARAGTSAGESQSWQEQIEYVLRPEEVVYETSREKERLVALMADGKPLFLRRLDYFRRFRPVWFESEKTIRNAERLRISGG